MHRNQRQEDTGSRALGELSDKNLKQAIKMFQQVKANPLETHGKLENHSQETEDIKYRQMEILELKNSITETENTLDRLRAE